MTNPTSRILAAVAGVLSIGAAAAWAADAAAIQPSQDAKIRDLEAKVAALEAKQSMSRSEADATIASVLNDADRRSQLLQNTGSAEAGYDDGFYVRAGSFEFRPGLFFQFRNVLNYREDTTGPKADEFDMGFEVRRMRLEMNGTAFTKDFEYSFVWDANREGGGVELLDAWVKYAFNSQWAVRAGQFKDPLTHEKLVSSKRQLAADRSLMDNILGGSLFDRVQGITAVYGAKEAPLKAEFGITDGGPQSMNTNFTKHVFDFGIVGRVEYKLSGEWADYRDFTAKNSKGNLLVVGAAGDWSQAGDANLFVGTADVQWENNAGLGLYGAILFANRDEAFTGGDSSTDWGLLVQAGYMLNPSWEVFGRLDILLFDEDLALSGGNTEDTFFEITGGVNYYLGPNGSYGHRAKITLDLTILPNGAPDDVSGLGILGANDGGTEVVFRSQFQLAI
jgi:Phosphate-selective porin O and P